MKKIFIIISLSFLFCLCMLGQDFGTTLKDDANSLWSLNPGKFKTTFGSPEMYKWKSPLKNILLYTSNGAGNKLLFFDQAIGKANFNFKSKQLQGISLTLAKSNDLTDKETYLEHVANIKEQILGLGKLGAPKVRKKTAKGRCRYTYSWRSPEYYITLKSSYSINSKKSFSPGYIKFYIFRRFAITTPIGKDEPASEKTTKLNPNIKTDDKGDRYLKVPMIKESSPKECVTVCAKRIFAYYKTAPKDRSWTRISENMKLNVKSAKGLKQIYASFANECRCSVKKLVTTNIFDDFNSIIKFIRDYNTQAAKMKKSRIDSFKINSFSKLLGVMDEEVLIKARNNPRKIKEFKDKICKEIDAAKPVLWVVFLGVVKEETEPPATGGHVRLIVGYNPKTNEIIYSDNWGKAHKLKKMSWEKAWTMTLSVLAVNIKK